MFENLLFACLPDKCRPACRGKPSPRFPYAPPMDDLEVVIADSGLLLFRGGELCAAIPSFPVPELRGSSFETHYTGVIATCEVLDFCRVGD